MNQDIFTNHLQAMQDIADKHQAEQLAQVESEKEQNRLEQISAGNCNIVPFPKKLKTEPFRSELTIEQSSLFVANRFKGDHFVREWTIASPKNDKEIAVHKLIVGKTDGKDKRSWGVLKQVHQDVFYKLLRLWGEKGYPLGSLGDESHGCFTITAYEMVKAIRGDDSEHHYRRVRELLHELASIPVILEVEHIHRGDVDRKQFTLLSDVFWNENKLDKKTRRPKPGGCSKVKVLFSSMITKGFLDKHYKTLLGEPYRLLGGKSQRQRGELARLLYPYLDAQLATKTNFHIKLRSLVDRFGLTQHRKMSHRKRQFVPAVNVLQGKMIKSEDYVLKVHLRESTEEDDFVLVAKREPNQQLRLFKEED